MDAATLVCHRFRGTRQLVGHLAAAGAGLVLFVVLGVSVVVAPPSTGSTGETLAVKCDSPSSILLTRARC